jgi:hypothetical protein
MGMIGDTGKNGSAGALRGIGTVILTRSSTIIPCLRRGHGGLCLPFLISIMQYLMDEIAGDPTTVAR